MRSLVKGVGLFMVCAAAQAGTAPILLEACNLFDERDKRLECLRAANGLGAGSSAQGTSRPGRPEPVRSAMPNTLGAFDGAPGAARSSGSPSSYPTPSAYQAPSAPSSRGPARASGGATCYTGPRGGTYTITASGRKNYGGC